ncbi:MAG: hypothetical protein QNJ55_19645 [Xenococcus sp. MO_188.B8]|nr:hypothetical protein [Xenococcus sp. MO_188.B8]
MENAISVIDKEPEVKAHIEELRTKYFKKIISPKKTADASKVIIAIEALKQQIDSTLIRSPEAWLSAAIRDSWKPNEAMGEEKAKDTFSEWYELANAYGIVTECRQEENQWLVKENVGQWHSYDDFSQKWT